MGGGNRIERVENTYDNEDGDTITDINYRFIPEGWSPDDDYAAGGIARLNRGRYLGGPTDGMADVVPANIEGTQEARLSDGEFVMPADIVSHLGNGNSNAGAETLYAMMDRIRKARTGTKKQGKKINTNNFLPV